MTDQEELEYNERSLKLWEDLRQEQYRKAAEHWRVDPNQVPELIEALGRALFTQGACVYAIKKAGDH